MVKSLFYIRHCVLQGKATHPSHGVGVGLKPTPTFRNGSTSIRACGLTLNRQHNYGVLTYKFLVELLLEQLYLYKILH